MPGKAVPEGKHGLPNVCFSPNLVNCKQDFGGWIPRSFFFTTSGCGDVGSCFFVLHPAYSSSSRRPAPSSPPLYFNSLYQLTVSLSISLCNLSLSHSSPSTSRSIIFFCIHLYQLLSLSINLSLAHSSLSTSLYHLAPYPLLSITFISMNFSLPHSSLSTSLSQLVHWLDVPWHFLPLDWLVGPWALWPPRLFRVASVPLLASVCNGFCVEKCVSVCKGACLQKCL